MDLIHRKENKIIISKWGWNSTTEILWPSPGVALYSRGEGAHLCPHKSSGRGHGAARSGEERAQPQQRGRSRGTNPDVSSSCAPLGHLLQDWDSKAFFFRHFQPPTPHLQCRAGGRPLHRGLHLPRSGRCPTAPARGRHAAAQWLVPSASRQLRTLTTRCMP